MDQESTTPDGSSTRPTTSGSPEGYADGLIGGTTSSTEQRQFQTMDQGSSSTINPSGIEMYLAVPNASQVNITNIVHQSSEPRTSNWTTPLTPVHHHQYDSMLRSYTADCGDDMLWHTLPDTPLCVPTSSPHYRSHITKNLSTGKQQASAWVPSNLFNQGFCFQSSRSSSSGSTQLENDRTFLPSQLGKSSSGVFTPDAKHLPSQNGPGARMLCFSPTQRYSGVTEGLGIVPAPFTSIDQRINIPAPPISGYGISLGESLVTIKAAEGSSTPKFKNSKIHGHRRNKTTVSDMAIVMKSPGGKRLAPPNFQIGSPTIAPAADLKQKLPVDHASASSQLKYEYAQRVTTDEKSPSALSLALAQTELKSQDVPDVFTATKFMRLSPVHEQSTVSAPSSDEDFISFTKVSHERTESGHSTNSISTIASESWNVVDDFAAFREDQPALTNNASDLRLAYQQGFGLDFEQLTWEEAREIYPSDQYLMGTAEHSVNVSDFAYMAEHPINTSTSAKHVSFASIQITHHRCTKSRTLMALVVRRRRMSYSLACTMVR
jgi:hypothetical protein